MKKWKLKSFVKPKMLVGYGYELIENEFDKTIGYAMKKIEINGEDERLYINLDRKEEFYKMVAFDYIPLNEKRAVTSFIKDLIEAKMVEVVK